LSSSPSARIVSERGSGADWPLVNSVFDAATMGGIIFTAPTGIDANTIVRVQQQMRERVLP
jgi:hypothetical protein